MVLLSIIKVQTSLPIIRLMLVLGKGKVHPITGHEGPEGEQMYSSTLPSTSALEGWSAPCPGMLVLGATLFLVVIYCQS